jgi:hypothetical protein
MTRKDAVVLASRALAVLFVVGAFAEASYLPEFLHSFRHYINQEPSLSPSLQYWRHYYVIRTGFLVVRIIGYFLIARWLYKGVRKSKSCCRPLRLAKMPARTDLQRVSGGTIR